MVTTLAERLTATKTHYRRVSTSTTMAAASCGAGHPGVTVTVTTRPWDCLSAPRAAPSIAALSGRPPQMTTASRPSSAMNATTDSRQLRIGEVHCEVDVLTVGRNRGHHEWLPTGGSHGISHRGTETGLDTSDQDSAHPRRIWRDRGVRRRHHAHRVDGGHGSLLQPGQVSGNPLPGRPGFIPEAALVSAKRATPLHVLATPPCAAASTRRVRHPPATTSAAARRAARGPAVPPASGLSTATRGPGTGPTAARSRTACAHRRNA